MKAVIDFETRSRLDVRIVGPYQYSAHESTRIQCLSWKLDAGPVRTWTPLTVGFKTDSLDELFSAIRDGAEIEAHNASFERCIWDFLGPRHSFPPIALEQWRCSLARAAICGLPLGLDALCRFLGLPQQKDAEGAKLMKRLASDTSTGQAELFDRGFASDEELKRLFEYCEQDVRAEAQLDEVLPPMPKKELDIWRLDQEINHRGVEIDRKLCAAVEQKAISAKARLAEELAEITFSKVTAATQTKRIRQLLESKLDRQIDSLDEESLRNLLADDTITGVCRRVLEIRRDGGKSSTAKFPAMLGASQVDGRARYSLRYGGANTGRWAGSGIQPHNLPRGDVEDVDTLCEVLTDCDVFTVDTLYGDVIGAARSAARSAIVAAPGKSLVCWDLGQIEARNLAWQAQEKWKLKAFRECDANRELPDLYEQAYARAMGLDAAEVDKAGRQVGKCMELALGFGGGVGAFLAFTKVYGVKIGESYQVLCEMFPEDAGNSFENFAKQDGGKLTDRETWIAADILKTRWRRAHPATVAFWRRLEKTAIEVADGAYNAGRWQRVNSSLCTYLLHSNRRLFFWNLKAERREKGSPNLTYTKRATSGQMVREHTFGGKLCENIVQGESRDLLTEAMLSMRDEFPLVLHVHDEIVAEVDTAKAEDVLEAGYEHMKAASRKWARDLPLVSSGFISKRYKK